MKKTDKRKWNEIGANAKLRTQRRRIINICVDSERKTRLVLPEVFLDVFYLFTLLSYTISGTCFATSTLSVNT